MNRLRIGQRVAVVTDEKLFDTGRIIRKADGAEETKEISIASDVLNGGIVAFRLFPEESVWRWIFPDPLSDIEKSVYAMHGPTFFIEALN